LQYLIFDDEAAESIQKMAKLAKENINEYITISAEIAESTVELMKFYVDTKKLLYGFPLITVPPTDHINVGPSVSQQIDPIEVDTEVNNAYHIENDSNRSVVTNYSEFSKFSSTFYPFAGSTFDAIIEKILLYKNRTISSTQLAQILRVRDHIL
jgi:hypothetical protein